MSSPDQQQKSTEARPRVVPVILSGGAGTRLWPLSTDQNPKQFHALSSARTLFQETVARATGADPVEFLPPVIICSARHRSAVERQLSECGVQPSELVLEPFGRNTAAATAIAAASVGRLHPGALALLMPADHVVPDQQAFRHAVAAATRMAFSHIVTFGIAATRAETGYGYIQRGERLADDVYEVARFAEKPSAAVAAAYVADGDYAWNGGIFLFSPGVMLGELQRLRPDIASAGARAYAEGRLDGVARFLDEQAFADCPSESIDYAVMEHTTLAAVTPLDAGWADVGSWSELWELGSSDASGNVVTGRAIVDDSAGCLVWAGEGRRVAILGVSDLIVASVGDTVMVLPRNRAQEVRKLAAAAAQGD